MQLLPHALPRVHILQQAAPTLGARAVTAFSSKNGRLRAIRVVSDRSVVSTKVPSMFATIEIVPSASVRWTRAPTLCHCWMTSGDGCPYAFLAPTEITATSGRVVWTQSVLVPFQLP
jgi:hypothetical protein